MVRYLTPAFTYNKVEGVLLIIPLNSAGLPTSSYGVQPKIKGVFGGNEAFGMGPVGLAVGVERIFVGGQKHPLGKFREEQSYNASLSHILGK